jgi:hypothetical protein
MRTNPFSAAAALRGAALRRFAVHYLQMLVAMVLGMVLLMPLWRPVLGAAGAAGLLDRTTVHLLVMATDMALGMALWMLVRRHSLAAVGEMTLAMYLPFAVLLVPLWAGALSPGAVSAAGHLLMLPAMALAMLLRASDYTHTPRTPHPAT